MSLELKLLQEAIAMLDDKEKEALLQAQQHAPHLVATESDPQRFLRRHEGNPWSAAQRLAEYWDLRRSVFGERWLRPLDLTGEGAFTSQDVAFIQMGSGVLLSPDKDGSPVGYVDRSRIHGVTPDHPNWDQLTIRNAYLLMQRYSEYETSQTEGAVLISRPLYDGKAHYQPSFMQFVQRAVQKAFPVRLKATHFVIVIPSALRRHFFRAFFPLISRRAGAFFRASVILHVTESPEGALTFLESHGLKKEGLPPRVGGTWSYSTFDSWFREQQMSRTEEEKALSSVLHVLGSVPKVSLAFEFASTRAAAPATQRELEVCNEASADGEKQPLQHKAAKRRKRTPRPPKKTPPCKPNLPASRNTAPQDSMKSTEKALKTSGAIPVLTTATTETKTTNNMPLSPSTLLRKRVREERQPVIDDPNRSYTCANVNDANLNSMILLQGTRGSNNRGCQNEQEGAVRVPVIPHAHTETMSYRALASPPPLHAARSMTTSQSLSSSFAPCNTNNSNEEESNEALFRQLDLLGQSQPAKLLSLLQLRPDWTIPLHSYRQRRLESIRSRSTSTNLTASPNHHGIIGAQIPNMQQMSNVGIPPASTSPIALADYWHKKASHLG